MHRRPRRAAVITGTVTVTLASLFLTLPAGASSNQPSTVVSLAPVDWTPNVSAGPTVGDETYCDATLFGAGNLSCQSEVYGTAYVNGDVVASGAFTEVCQPGTLKEGLCAPGTQVKRDDIFAYSAGTGKIDPNFVPVLDAGPAWSVVTGPPGSNTVYVGGAFTTVDGISHKGLVELNVHPGVTTGATADGSIVTAFKASINNEARHVALSPDDSALYVSGQFSGVDGVSKFSDGAAVGDLARVNATTGALDSSFAFTLTDATSGSPVKAEAMALSPDGTHLAFSGSFQKVNGQPRPRLAIVDTGVTLGAVSTLSDWTAPILSNNCSKQHDYVRGLAFSPDSTFIVTADTGLDSDGSTPFSTCDAVARYDVNATNTASTGTPIDVSPAWIDYAGGDSFYSVAVAGGVVYAGGHDRWANNYCGNNFVCEPNAVLVDGLSALDANTGIALAWWHPETLRGHGTMYLSTFPAGTYDGTTAGLAQGTDVDNIAGTYHSEEALFPVAAATSATPGGPIPSGMFNEDGGTNTGIPMCIDDANNSAASGNPVELSSCADDAEQNWSIETNDTIQINGLCLDTAAGATATGTSLALNTCVTSRSTQQWTQGTGNVLINKGATAADKSQVCLTDPGAATVNGTRLQIDTCDGATSQVWPLPAAQGPPPPPPVGPVFSRQVQSNSQVPCLDDANDSVATGNKVQLWTCTGDTEQNWTIESGGTMQINGNYCLDSSSPTTKGAVSVVLDPCDSSATERWSAQLISGNNSELVNAGATSLNGSPYCLVDPGGDTTNGTQLQISTCKTSKSSPVEAHGWRLPAV